MASEGYPVPRFCSRCGHGELAERSAWEFQCVACDHKFFINPVSAVAALLQDAEGRLLLLRRERDPGKGKLGLPGGFVDPGETAEEAIRREILEETGLEVSSFRYLFSLPNTYEYQGESNPVLDLFYTAQVRTFEGAAALAEVAALEVVWPNELEFNEMAFASNAEALRYFLGGQ